jgi:cyclin-dependent kinase 2
MEMDRLERFEKLERIGEGTYGVVYKARDLDCGDMVAMKRIRFQHEDEGIPSTAIREISLLKTLKHPNIVPLREVIYRDEKLHLIFDFLDMDLKKCLKSTRGPLPPAKVQSYMK